LGIETHAHARHGNAVSNFAALLPAPQSDLAQQTLKDPYIVDFLTLTEPFQAFYAGRIIREPAMKAYRSTVSLPFDADPNNSVAAKTIDDRGIAKPQGASARRLTWG
jgi:hypothetical protein